MRRHEHQSRHHRSTVRLQARDLGMQQAVSSAARARLLGTLVRLGGAATLSQLHEQLAMERALLTQAIQVAVIDGLVCATPGGTFHLRTAETANTAL